MHWQVVQGEDTSQRTRRWRQGSQGTLLEDIVGFEGRCRSEVEIKVLEHRGEVPPSRFLLFTTLLPEVLIK